MADLYLEDTECYRKKNVKEAAELNISNTKSRQDGQGYGFSGDQDMKGGNLLKRTSWCREVSKSIEREEKLKKKLTIF